MQLSHPIVYAAAADLATDRPEADCPLYIARNAAREIIGDLRVALPGERITIAALAPQLQQQARWIATQRTQREQMRQLGEDPIHRAICDRHQVCEIDADPDLRRALRRIAGCADHDAVAVRAVWGTDAPTERGATYTKYHQHNGLASGTVYHPSTRRVEVGVGWLSAHLGVLLAGQAA